MLKHVKEALLPKKNPPPPFPLTRRATDSDLGGSRPPLRRRPSIHNAQHRLRMLWSRAQDPPPLPPRPMDITGPLDTPRMEELDEWDDLRLAAWAVGARRQRDDSELPRPKPPRPMPPHRLHTF